MSLGRLLPICVCSLAVFASTAVGAGVRSLTVPSTTSPLHPISTGISAVKGARLTCSGKIIYQMSPSDRVAPCTGDGATDVADYGNVVNGHSNGLIFRIGHGRWRGMTKNTMVIKGAGVVQVAVNDGLKGCPNDDCWSDNSGSFTVRVSKVPAK